MAGADDLDVLSVVEKEVTNDERKAPFFRLARKTVGAL
jgi:hypothetical protein